jgi:hypothetical protein
MNTSSLVVPDRFKSLTTRESGAQAREDVLRLLGLTDAVRPLINHVIQQRLSQVASALTPEGRTTAKPGPRHTH